MGASDYMVGNAPGGASYQMGDMAQQLYEMISALPKAYYQGQQNRFQQGQNRRTEELQGLFKDGLPTDAQGKPLQGMDLVNAIGTKSLQTGGVDYAKPLMDMLLQQQGAKTSAEAFGTPQPGQPVNQNTSPTGQTPAMLQRPSGGGTSAGSGDNGRNTITSMVTENSDNPDAVGPTIAKVAKYIGIDPNAPITNPRDMVRVQNAMKAAGVRVQAAGGAPAGRPVPTASSPEESNDTTPVGTGGPNLTAPPGGPSQAAPGGGGQISPSPQGSSFNDRFGATKSADWYENRGQNKLRASTALGVNKQQAEGLKASGEADLATAKQMREIEGKITERTDPRVAAAKAGEEVVKADIEQSKKKYDGLQNLGQVGQIGNQKLDRIRSIMSDPDFMSGAGHSIAQAWNQWNVTLGGNPSKAQPMEEFNKTAQQLLTDDIKAMGQSGAGPVRVAEVQIMQKATANLGISPATNRYLVEEAYRVHNDNVAVARMAQQYKAQHGYLDAGWDKVRDKFYADHPLFTKAELADPRLVAPPYMPRDIAADPARRTVWLKQQGLKSGDPFKTDNPDNPIHYLK
jgi:hypothetical protein